MSSSDSSSSTTTINIRVVPIATLVHLLDALHQRYPSTRLGRRHSFCSTAVPSCRFPTSGKRCQYVRRSQGQLSCQRGAKAMTTVWQIHGRIRNRSSFVNSATEARYLCGGTAAQASSPASSAMVPLLPSSCN
jgi:hypothetical protein